jgi:hypothetical protein
MVGFKKGHWNGKERGDGGNRFLLQSRIQKYNE